MKIIQLVQFVILLSVRNLGRALSSNSFLRFSFFIIIVLFFVLASRTMLLRGQYVYYTGISLILIIYLNFNRKKTEFYKQQFSHKVYYLLVLVQCLITALPFIVMILLSERLYWYYCLYPILFCLIFPAFSLRTFSFSGVTIPSIYSKESYEFNYGFRLLFPLYFILTSLLIIGAFVDNVNLFALSSASIIVLTSFSQNGKFIGETQFLRMYKCSPKEIIISKCRQGIVNMLLLCTPIVVISIVDITNLLFVSVVTISLGVLYYTYSILCRFSFIHSKIVNEIVQISSLTIFTSVAFFPLFLVLIALLMYILYWRANKILNSLLDD